MTCIVGMIDKNKNIFIGADSAGSNGYDIRTRTDKKVFINGDMIFGFTSSFRMGQLLRYSLKIPKHSQVKDDYAYLCTDFINAVIKCLEKNKYAHVKDNVASGGTFIFGYKNNLYTVEGNFQVEQINLNYTSCGSGEDYAMGALYAMDDALVLTSAEEKIKRALEAAQEFSAGVRGPFEILKLESKEKHEKI